MIIFSISEKRYFFQRKRENRGGAGGIKGNGGYVGGTVVLPGSMTSYVVNWEGRSTEGWWGVEEVGYEVGRERRVGEEGREEDEGAVWAGKEEEKKVVNVFGSLPQLVAKGRVTHDDCLNVLKRCDELKEIQLSVLQKMKKDVEKGLMQLEKRGREEAGVGEDVERLMKQVMKNQRKIQRLAGNMKETDNKVEEELEEAGVVGGVGGVSKSCRVYFRDMEEVKEGAGRMEKKLEKCFEILKRKQKEKKERGGRGQSQMRK